MVDNDVEGKSTEDATVPIQETKEIPRNRFTSCQREQLENEFHLDRYVSKTKIEEIAERLGVTETRVKTWFQNRRARFRKEQKRKQLITSHANAAYNAPMNSYTPVYSQPYLNQHTVAPNYDQNTPQSQSRKQRNFPGTDSLHVKESS
ncbi:homeobox protein Hox-B3-like [Rhynchophorus ferrugineus]|uniref:homeobox protein Hox-B3-like n=1 Tax=Rhynchophorus ferrugineus TaxID=354439 RepID=UPI003FCC4D32